jgi:hypothetical protein
VLYCLVPVTKEHMFYFLHGADFVGNLNINWTGSTSFITCTSLHKLDSSSVLCVTFSCICFLYVNLRKNTCVSSYVEQIRTWNLCARTKITWRSEIWDKLAASFEIFTFVSSLASSRWRCSSYVTFCRDWQVPHVSCVTSLTSNMEEWFFLPFCHPWWWWRS